ncbi:16S rRNA pseudouridine516 synthase [Peptoclostridium litorale DSM 5388]|uniref:Pseudouridine synthase n=1 Tax=Peptoclostridium litorale DSM 5388 TaxID=1121324 RepID=A0A069RNB3_PEPLI|nr:pseudouridine synthase [Peptoclostridium litorale]KDR95657.1 pseudouridine synthase [Peptoclostridium litorale DSM 5388]SIO00426.1 16S rRNA pseudouridine516 synthase [Peptoclostridium litorale DSM 5388]
MANKMRLDKMLSNIGYGSRRDIKEALKRGLVKVNGSVEKSNSRHVDTDSDVVEFDGEKVSYREFVYIMLNKPDGYISATEDNRDRTVLELIDPVYLAFKPFPVGRLDKDTEGLLVLTNDGALAHRVLSPKKHVKKRYYAKIDGRVTKEDIEAFKTGVQLDDGYNTLPAELEILQSGECSEIELTIVEGKFHQVKRMFEAVGKKVTYLKRLSMGELRLDNALELGEYRELTDEELLMLEER